MLSTEFNAYIEKVPCLLPHYAGVYSLDTIPKNLRIRSFAFFNSQKIFHRGQHWLTIIRSQPNTVEIFDSLGTKYDQIKPYLKFNKNTDIVYNNKAFQLPTTSTCGYYAITFAVERCMNFDLKYKEVLASVFTDNLHENEDMVTTFVKNL